MNCMKEIQLTKGVISFVDDEDFDLSQFKWRTALNKRSYTAYGVREISFCELGKDRKRKSEHLHRVILERKIGRELTAEEVTDHIDGNGLNNRRCNLQAVTQSQNMFRARLSKSNTTGYKGIWWNKSKKGWDVYINKNKKRYRFGRFKNFDEAIKARLEAERIIWQNEHIHHFPILSTQ